MSCAKPQEAEIAAGKSLDDGSTDFECEGQEIEDSIMHFLKPQSHDHIRLVLGSWHDVTRESRAHKPYLWRCIFLVLHFPTYCSLEIATTWTGQPMACQHHRETERALQRGTENNRAEGEARGLNKNIKLSASKWVNLL